MPRPFQAYQHALRTWENYHTTTSASGLADCFALPDDVSSEQITELLRLIPAPERRPVAFGCFLKAAGNWRPIQQTGFLGEFLSDPGPVEREILEAAARGQSILPEKLPVTVEEFPSRIWKRGLARNSTVPLVTAGCQAVKSMKRLLHEHEDDTDIEDPEVLMTFRIPSGDLPDVMDLAALSPSRFRDMKNRIIDHVMDDVLRDRFEVGMGDMEAIRAWVLLETDERADGPEQLAAEARATMENYLITGRPRDHHHTCRLGRLMFRFGRRRLSTQCAEVLGHSPWDIGWQFQSISGSAHARIRNAIVRPGHDSDAWRREPALACSAMSIPLWLTDGVERVSDLVALFKQAAACPWIFPRLRHIYQWHLALAGDHASLRQIEELAPDLAVGLSEKPTHGSSIP